jgi:hypothetical protein
LAFEARDRGLNHIQLLREGDLCHFSGPAELGEVPEVGGFLVGEAGTSSGHAVGIAGLVDQLLG